MSVLLPVRDAAAHVTRALASVLDQTLADLEVVVVDDGSTDGTAALLDRVDDDRVRVVHRPFAGLVASLNAGLALVRARYVARMDADDLCAPDRLARQVAFLDAEPDVVVVGSAFDVIDEDDRVVKVEAMLPDDDDLRRELYLRNPFAHGSVMLRADSLREVGGYRDGYVAAEDYDLWRRLATVGRLANLDAVLYHWRQHASGVSQTASSSQHDSARRLLDELWATGGPQILDRVALRDRAARYRARPELGGELGEHFDEVQLAIALQFARRGHRRAACEQLWEFERHRRGALVATGFFAASGGRVTSARRFWQGFDRRRRARGRR